MITEPQRVCSICGNEFSGTMEFCPVCTSGKRISQVVAATPRPTLVPSTRDSKKPSSAVGTGAALFEADLVEGVFHRLAGDPDDSLERRIELLRHFDCPCDRECAEEQRQYCCRVTRREQAEA